MEKYDQEQNAWRRVPTQTHLGLTQNPLSRERMRNEDPNISTAVHTIVQPMTSVTSGNATLSKSCRSGYYYFFFQRCFSMWLAQIKHTLRPMIPPRCVRHDSGVVDRPNGQGECQRTFRRRVFAGGLIPNGGLRFAVRVQLEVRAIECKIAA